jgi:hypothetical protein
MHSHCCTHHTTVTPLTHSLFTIITQLINEKPQIIQDYESGKAIPNPQILSKLSRVLGVTLRKSGK